MYERTYEMARAAVHRPQQAPRRFARFQVRPVSGALGAEATGLDLRALDDVGLADLEQALADHLVLFIRDQTLTPADQVAFARRLGTPIVWPYVKPLAGHPEIMEIRSEPTDVYNFGGDWHSDSMNFERPPKFTMLHCLETPPTGGDTSFANLYMAWESLSPGLQRLLEPVKGVNSAAQGYGAHPSSEEVKSKATTTVDFKAEQDNEVEHPIARTHPVTGRKALYVCDSFTVRFADASQEESLPLLRFLWTRAIQPEFTCRMSWRPGTLALWDNRCTLHYAHNDYPGFRRVMHRVVIEGERPV
jgi:taurine dioxygenase